MCLSVFLSYVIDGDIYEIWRYLILIAYMVITISESCVSRISCMKSNRFVYVRHISYWIIFLGVIFIFSFYSKQGQLKFETEESARGKLDQLLLVYYYFLSFSLLRIYNVFAWSIEPDIFSVIAFWRYCETKHRAPKFNENGSKISFPIFCWDVLSPLSAVRCRPIVYSFPK